MTSPAEPDPIASTAPFSTPRVGPGEFSGGDARDWAERGHIPTASEQLVSLHQSDVFDVDAPVIGQQA